MTSPCSVVTLFDQRTPKVSPLRDVHTSARSVEQTTLFPELLRLVLLGQGEELFCYGIMLHALLYLLNNRAATRAHDCSQGSLATKRVSYNISLPQLILECEIELS